MTLRGKTVGVFKLGFVVLVTIYIGSLLTNTAVAAQITTRSLTLQDRGTTGGSTPGGNVNHQFAYTLPGSNTVGSIKFEYCTTPSGPSNPACTAPGGLDTSTVTLGTNTGVAFDSAVSDSANVVHVTKATPAAVGSNVAVVTQLLNVKNPTTANQSFYIRISTYANSSATGSAQDTGSVAASTATQIQLSGYMPESLIFCTGGTVTTTGGVPDCSTATSGSISFNQAFSPSDTAWAISQMAASTNADSGYTITYSGDTLKSGSNPVSPMSAATTSTRGTSQFGLDLVTNDGTAYANAPNVTGSANISPSSGGSHQGKVTANYTTAGTFKFTTSGDTIANSNFGGSSVPSDSQIYTVSYIVNANGAQPVGTYTTTLTYVCTATF
jgi:hypothetical protein